MKRLKEFLKEIHRRSIWQVLGVYGAGSWAAFEFTVSLTESTGLPGWFPSFALGLLVLGLPVVLATAIVGGGGREPDEPYDGHDVFAEPDSAAASLFTWRNVLLGGVAAAALWGVVATVLLVRGDGLPMAGPGAEADSGAQAGQPRVLAVIPMTNLTGDEDLQYLADGLHDEILTRIQQAGGVRVMSRTSMLRYRDTDLSIREIGRELGADVILESSLRSAGGQIRVTGQLIDAETDEHLWADSFDEALDTSDLFTVQTDIALAIADAMVENLAADVRSRMAEVGTDDSQAQRQYLLGIFYRNRALPGDLQASLEAYDEALALDPDFALAWAAKAESYMMLAHSGMPPWVAFPQGEEAARRALAIDPDLAEAHTTIADVRYHYDWDWEGSEESFRRALELNPNHATAHWWFAGLLSTLRRHDEAVRQVRTAMRLDPGGVTHWFASRVLMWAGRLEESWEVIGEGLEKTPDHPWLLEARGIHRVRWGETDEERQAGLADLERAVGMGPGPHHFSRAMALALLGREEEARQLAAAIPANAPEGVYVSPYFLAQIHAELGDTDRALELLEEAAESRDGPFIWLNIDPPLRSLHGEPRFQALVDEMVLTLADFDERGAPVVE